MSPCSDSKLRSQAGQSMVLFPAVVLPLILFIAVISVALGNWWVHKRKLQTQVDAAAARGRPESFMECFARKRASPTR